MNNRGSAAHDWSVSYNEEAVATVLGQRQTMGDVEGYRRVQRFTREDEVRKRDFANIVLKGCKPYDLQVKGAIGLHTVAGKKEVERLGLKNKRVRLLVVPRTKDPSRIWAHLWYLAHHPEAERVPGYPPTFWDKQLETLKILLETGRILAYEPTGENSWYIVGRDGMPKNLAFSPHSMEAKHLVGNLISFVLQVLRE